MMKEIRLDKFLAMNHLGTRSEVKKLLKNNLITINGIRAVKPECKVDPDTDQIAINGKIIRYEAFLALMFHKPAGCITATQDKKQKTVMDYIDYDRKSELFPVGRLDQDTEGLLILTNDGDLAHKMLSPRHHVSKTYFVRVEGMVNEQDIIALENGIDIGEKQVTMPAEATLLYSGDQSEVMLTIREGKYHQVKRMFQARGKKVIYLKRISMAGIDLDENLAAGEWRECNESERKLLLCLKDHIKADEKNM